MRLTLFSWFLTICMSFSPILSAHAPAKPFFSQEQEEFLALNLPVYSYFSELYVGHHRTPQEIAAEHHLSDETSVAYLKALENIGLIKKEKENRLSAPVHFLVTGVSTCSAGGPLSASLTKLIITNYHDKVMALIDEKSRNFYWSNPGLWLTEAQYKESREELKALEEKYFNLSVKNRKSKNANAFRVSATFGLIPHWEPDVFHNIETPLEIKNNVAR